MSDEIGDASMNDGVTKLSEASFAEDWDSAEDRVYDPTTKAERETKRAEMEGMRDSWESNFQIPWDESLYAFVLRLIAEVERLEAELDGRIAADAVLCPHAPNHVLEGKLRELEEVNTNLARRILDLEADKHEADDAATH
ncbi:hypothetical protein LCGC14_1410990 [marine sediment metagenome]|uniref:Uncharacterized protein n=1 Tax=marine sediment metagenome TaxID=412755 RepID=A0A0F9M9P0_9ZZZZ